MRGQVTGRKGGLRRTDGFGPSEKARSPRQRAPSTALREAKGDPSSKTGGKP